ncbi:MAG: Cro/Cl family transcriptional regulator [Haloplasmataceae bacterium]|nr:Cro/Cl family transcriptional regulator [Haloplasmataceae bacterium]
MNIGSKIKRLRMENGLTQEELADRCELTKGFISQLEREMTSPSIATLCDILEALGTSISEFFEEDSDEKIVFKAEDVFIKNDEEANMTINWIVPNAQKNEMEPILVELNSGGSTYKHTPHPGEEFGYILEGEVELIHGKRKLIVKKGESFYFIPNKEHYIKNRVNRVSKILWVSTPPSF